MHNLADSGQPFLSNRSEPALQRVGYVLRCPWLTLRAMPEVHRAPAERSSLLAALHGVRAGLGEHRRCRTRLDQPTHQLVSCLLGFANLNFGDVSPGILADAIRDCGGIDSSKIGEVLSSRFASIVYAEKNDSTARIRDGYYVLDDFTPVLLGRKL